MKFDLAGDFYSTIVIYILIMVSNYIIWSMCIHLLTVKFMDFFFLVNQSVDDI